MAKIIAPVVTIFNEEEKPDYAGNKKVIDFLIEGGLDGILVLGSAGEFPDLNEQERLDFFRFYAEYVNGLTCSTSNTIVANYVSHFL